MARLVRLSRVSKMGPDASEVHVPGNGGRKRRRPRLRKIVTG